MCGKDVPPVQIVHDSSAMLQCVHLGVWKLQSKRGEVADVHHALRTQKFHYPQRESWCFF